MEQGQKYCALRQWGISKPRQCSFGFANRYEGIRSFRSIERIVISKMAFFGKSLYGCCKCFDVWPNWKKRTAL